MPAPKRSIYFSIDESSFHRHLEKENKTRRVTKVRNDLTKLKANNSIIRNKDLTDLLRKETAFALTGKDDASVLSPYASLTTTDNNLSFGISIEAATRLFIAPQASAKISSTTKDIDLTSKDVGSDITLGFRASYFFRGFLNNSDKATTSNSMYAKRLSRLSDQAEIFDANRKNIESVYANSKASILKDTLAKLTGFQETKFWKEDLAYFLQNSSYRKLHAAYGFVDFESALGDNKLIYRDSLKAIPTTGKFLNFSAAIGVGEVYRWNRYRLNWTLTLGLQNTSNATSGLLEPTTISTVIEVDSLTSRIKESSEYIGRFKQKAEFFVGGSLLYYFSNLKFDGISKIEPGFKIALRRILSNETALRKDDSVWSGQFGFIFSIRDKDGKPSVVLFPHGDTRNNDWSFRLSAGVPF